MRPNRLVVGFAILAALVAACEPESEPELAPEPEPELAPELDVPTLKMVTATEQDDLNRVRRSSGPFDPVWQSVLEPLAERNEAGELVPVLATSWEPSDDLITWRFHLREGVKFHNGDDFTAQDVVETSRYMLDIEDSRVFRYVPLQQEAIAIDDYTVDLMFEGPQVLLPLNIGEFLIYPAAIARDNRDLADTSVIGTGPYTFVEWRRGQDVSLSKFDEYWGPEPHIDEVVISFRAEESVRLAALQAGEAHWVEALSSESADLAPKAVSTDSVDTVFIRFDQAVQKEWTETDPIFADKRLRLAVDYAIDRETLLGLYGGLASVPLGQFGSSGDFGFNPDLESRPYDLERARALVEEAGAVGETATMVANAGRFPNDRELAEAVAAMIEETGLKVELATMPTAEATEYLRVEGDERMTMSDMMMHDSDALFETESRYRTIFTDSGPHFALNDLEPTRLFDDVIAEQDFDTRAEKLAQAWAYVHEEAHYVPIIKLPWIWGLAENLDWEPPTDGVARPADMAFVDS